MYQELAGAPAGGRRGHRTGGIPERAKPENIRASQRAPGHGKRGPLPQERLTPAGQVAVRRRMDQYGLKYRDVAAIVGCSVSHLSNVFRGRRGKGCLPNFLLADGPVSPTLFPPSPAKAHSVGTAAATPLPAVVRREHHVFVGLDDFSATFALATRSTGPNPYQLLLKAGHGHSVRFTTTGAGRSLDMELVRSREFELMDPRDKGWRPYRHRFDVRECHTGDVVANMYLKRNAGLYCATCKPTLVHNPDVPCGDARCREPGHRYQSFPMPARRCGKCEFAPDRWRKCGACKRLNPCEACDARRRPKELLVHLHGGAFRWGIHGQILSTWIAPFVLAETGRTAGYDVLVGTNRGMTSQVFVLAGGQAKRTPRELKSYVTVRDGVQANAHTLGGKRIALRVYDAEVARRDKPMLSLSDMAPDPLAAYGVTMRTRVEVRGGRQGTPLDAVPLARALTEDFAQVYALDLEAVKNRNAAWESLRRSPGRAFAVAKFLDTPPDEPFRAADPELVADLAGGSGGKPRAKRRVQRMLQPVLAYVRAELPNAAIDYRGAAAKTAPAIAEEICRAVRAPTPLPKAALALTPRVTRPARAYTDDDVLRGLAAAMGLADTPLQEFADLVEAEARLFDVAFAA